MPPVFHRLLLCLLVCLCLNACAPLPDVSPFAAATRGLRAAVQTSGTTVVGGLKDEDFPAEAAQLDAAWKARVETMRAMEAYADELASTVKSFGDAQANAGRLADTLTGLATAAGLIAPGGAAAGVVADAGGLLVAQLARVRAAASLQQAVEEAQPIVEAVATRLGRRLAYSSNGTTNDLTSMHSILRALEDSLRTDQLKATRKLTDARDELRTQRDSLVAGQFGQNRVGQDEFERLTGLIAKVESEMQIRSEPFKTRLEKVRTGRELVEATVEATDAWARAHADLLQAMNTRRPYSAEALAEAVVQIRALVKKAGEL